MEKHYITKLLPIEDIKDMVMEHRAAMIIQSFFRRSQYYLTINCDNSLYEWPMEHFHCKYDRHKEHGKSEFVQRFGSRCRLLSGRCKPLNLVLKRMMIVCVDEKADYVIRSKKKRKRPYHFNVTLMKKSRFRDLPIITVNEETVM